MDKSNKNTMKNYSLLGEDGKERPFNAMDDDQANGLCQKRYPGLSWKLYRVDYGERVEIGFAERPRPGNEGA